jgi:nitrite reductase/ring-hydroxylating ferredoxin subunit
MSANCSRRAFLEAGGCFAGILIAGGLPASLLAGPITEIEGTPAGAAERSYPLPASDSVSIDRTAQVILVRATGHVYAFALSCPHQNAAVKWVEKDHRFACTKHDSKYQPDGVYTSGRATRNLDRFPIRRAQDNVLIETSKVFQSDKDPGGWAAATVTV